ncbi:MAG: efflux RND transporter permease subunit [Gemmatimonas sp.]
MKQSEEASTKPAANAGGHPAIEGGGLSGIAIRRPVFATMVMVGLVVLGLFGFRRLAVDQFPDVDIPVVTVQTTYPGASAESIEREVTRRMEESFNPVEGVKTITSVSLEGVSQVVVEFELGRDVDLAAQDLRSKIEGIRRDLPAAIDPPVLQKLDPAAEPIMSLALRSEKTPIVELTSLADLDIRKRLEGVQGVGEVRIAGGLKREVRVYVDPAKMQSLGVSMDDVSKALRSQNLEAPAGRLENAGREQLVRVAGRINNPQQFAGIIVDDRVGNPVRLGDVARIEDGMEEERSLALINGVRAVSLDLMKVSGANTVDVADGVKAELEAVNKSLPEGVSIQIVRDNSVMIKQSVDDVLHELLLGALLTVLVVMLFLNDWKATTITALALPVSVVSSFVLMNALGFTLNVLTLMALSLSIGILIDDAIVVVENIVRHREMGEDHYTAAARGTSEIGLAVMATTLSIVAVFVPVAFMGGIIGRFFFQFGLTVAWAVLVSLFVSLTLTPMLAAHWGVDPHHGGAKGNVLTRAIAGFNRWFDRGAEKYRSVIAWALGHRKSTLALAVVAFMAGVALLPFVGGGFQPEADNSEFSVKFEVPEGSALDYSRKKSEQVIAMLRRIDGVDYVYATVGAGTTGTVRKGEAYVKLVPSHSRERTQAQTMVDARDSLSRIAGVTTSVLEAGGLGGAQAPLAIELRGSDVEELRRISAEVVKSMQSINGVVDIATSLGDPRPEYRIDVNRDEANKVGLDVSGVAATVRPILAGETVTRWEDPTGEEHDVTVQVAPSGRTSVPDLGALPLATNRRTSTGAAIMVPLRDVAQINLASAPAQLDRKNLQRVVTVSAGVSPELSVSEASALIREKLTAIPLPPGYQVGLGGETQQLEETGGYVIEAILLAIILIFLILASQFESVLQPFAIMLSLPLSLVGVLFALLMTNDTLNIMSMIGIIMLLGLVTKNAILLVDHANERRALGEDKRTALVEAGVVRLRPIIMTTLAMVFGMLPIALALGEGGGFRAPMARAVIGGLITSTLLTLVVVPVAYSYFDDFGAWVRKLTRRDQTQIVPVVERS